MTEVTATCRILPTQLIYVFRIAVTINFGYFPKLHLLIGISNGSTLFSMRYELNLYT
jgi:hypothetical protein